VVEERCELLLPPLLSCFPYACERLGHTSPTLCPVCACSPAFLLVPALAPPAPPPVPRHCSSASRLLWRSQTSHGRASSASAPRLPDADHSSTRYERCWRPWDLPVPYKKLLHMPGSVTRRVVQALANGAPVRVAFTFGTVSAPGMIGLSRFNGWPVHSPADASPTPLRASAHGSGQCGSLLLHRKGLPPSTPCRSPGALRKPTQERK